jgi:hypothetical protein
MSKELLLTPELIALINEAFNSEQANEYTLTDDGTLEGFSHEIVVQQGRYIVRGSDCSRCNGSHVNCEYVERVTSDPEEALENLELIRGMEGE